MPKLGRARTSARVHGHDESAPKIELLKLDSGRIGVAIGGEFSEITNVAALILAQRLVEMSGLSVEVRRPIVQALCEARAVAA